MFRRVVGISTNPRPPQGAAAFWAVGTSSEKQQVVRKPEDVGLGSACAQPGGGQEPRARTHPRCRPSRQEVSFPVPSGHLTGSRSPCQVLRRHPAGVLSMYGHPSGRLSPPCPLSNITTLAHPTTSVCPAWVTAQDAPRLLAALLQPHDSPHALRVQRALCVDGCRKSPSEHCTVSLE